MNHQTLATKRVSGHLENWTSFSLTCLQNLLFLNPFPGVTRLKLHHMTTTHTLICLGYLYVVDRYLWGGDRSFYVAGLKIKHVPPLQDVSNLPPRVTSYTVLSAMQGDDRGSLSSRLSSNKLNTGEAQRQQIVDMISAGVVMPQRPPMHRTSSVRDDNQGKTICAVSGTYIVIYSVLSSRKFAIAWGSGFSTKAIFNF